MKLQNNNRGATNTQI